MRNFADGIGAGMCIGTGVTMMCLGFFPSVTGAIIATSIAVLTVVTLEYFKDKL